MDVAEATFATLADQDLFAINVQVMQDDTGFIIGNYGAHGHAEGNVIGACAVAFGTHAVLAVTRQELAGVAVFDKRVDIAVCHGPDAAAFAAIAAAGAAPGHILLAAECGTAITTLAGNDFDTRFVNKFHDVLLLKKKPYR